jgi:hypothetical protein
MSMDNGLGRTGYLLLTTVMFGLGVLGIAIAYLAYVNSTLQFFMLGLGLAGVAMICMFGFAAWAPWLAAPKAEAVPSAPPAGKVVPEAEATTPGPHDFEFDDAVPVAAPAPSEAPEPVAFSERDPAAWPVRKGSPKSKSDWTARAEQEQQVANAVSESATRRKLQDRYTQTTPTVRSIVTEPELHVAERVPADFSTGAAVPGMTLGRCGRCKTGVMAPTTRPLRLKCPECAKVTLLN